MNPESLELNPRLLLTPLIPISSHPMPTLRQSPLLLVLLLLLLLLLPLTLLHATTTTTTGFSC